MAGEKKKGGNEEDVRPKGFSEQFTKEAYDTFVAFGHLPSKKIELEPFKYPYISEQNARLIRMIKQKKAERPAGAD